MGALELGREGKKGRETKILFEKCHSEYCSLYANKTF